MESELLIVARQKERSCVFEIEGLADNFWVVRFTGSEAISSLFEFHVEAVARHIDVNSLIGRYARLRIAGMAEPRVVHGLIYRAEYAGELRPRALYQISLVPWIYRLHLRTDCRIFQKKTTPEIVAQVLQSAGLPKRWVRLDLSGSYAPRDYCVQYRESDLQFIQRLLEEDGIFYYFEHEENRHVLVITDRAAGGPNIVGEAALPFHTVEGMIRDREHVSLFRVAEEIRPDKVTLRDHDLHRPDQLVEGSEQAAKSGGLELYDYPGEFSQAGLGRQLAKVQLEAAQATRRRGVGTSDCPRLTPGFAFTLAGHPRAELDAEYRVVRIQHTGEQPDVVDQSADHALIYRNEFVCMERRHPYRPPRVTPRPAVRGVQTATVVGPEGEEIFVDEHGRVKVQFHWDRVGTFNEQSSCWVRVSQLWAGNGYGAMFVPRVGHEVIVDFIEGDPDRPIVTGRVYHGNNATPYALPNEKTKSTIKSETHGGGGFNELRFEDQKGAEQVFMHAQRDMDLCVRNDRRESVLRDDHALVHRHRHEEIRGDRHTTIAGKANAKIGGDLSVTLSGAIDLQASGVTRVSVGGDADLTIDGAHHVAVAGDHHSKTGGGSEHKVGGAAKLEVGGPVSVKAPMIVLEASTGITIKAGGGFITIDASGISITGNLVKINSGGAALVGTAPMPMAPAAPSVTEPTLPKPAEGDA